MISSNSSSSGRGNDFRENNNNPIVRLKNTDETRVCHKCKGELDIISASYFLSLYKNKHKMQLGCLTCGVTYFLEDDILVAIQLSKNGSITYRPFPYDIVLG